MAILSTPSWTHFRGRVQHIQIWNEPNIYPEWGEQAVDPAAYAQMLQLAFRRAKEADPNIQVLSAPLATTLGEPHPQPGRWRSMPDLDYLEALYEAGAGDAFDILSANAFGFDLPPEDPPQADVLNFRRVELQREIMVRYGDADKAVWFNEYGWNAAPASFGEEALIWKRVSEEKQAEYTLQGIELAREIWPWAGVFNIWYFRQTGLQYPPDDAAHYFRMVDVDFTPRRVYDAVQDSTTALQVAVPGHIEETNPAVKADTDWQGVVSPEASGRAMIYSDKPGANVTVAFRGHAIDLITHQSPESGRLLVTLDGRNVAGLPLDEQGRSYLDLYAAVPASQVRLPIAQGLVTGQHVVRLAVDDREPAGCHVDAFQVNAGQPPAFPTLPVAALGTIIVAVIGALVWEFIKRPRPERFF
jgi:polysaccharide biosynthesis protein PslG